MIMTKTEFLEKVSQIPPGAYRVWELCFLLKCSEKILKHFLCDTSIKKEVAALWTIPVERFKDEDEVQIFSEGIVYDWDKDEDDPPQLYLFMEEDYIVPEYS